MDTWNQVATLQGRTLRTLGQAKTFTVVAVEHDSVIIRIHSTRNERPIHRDEIESAFGELQTRGEMPFVDIRGHKHSEVSPAYVAAILAALPGVTYTTNPVRLRYKRTG